MAGTGPVRAAILADLKNREADGMSFTLWVHGGGGEVVVMEKGGVDGCFCLTWRPRELHLSTVTFQIVGGEPNTPTPSTTLGGHPRH